MDIFHFILGPIRGVLVWFDTVVYDRIPDLYKLMLYLANVDVVSNNVPIQGLIQRIYILVGVFMLFKLSFSILNYIVNPDAFSDQSKGFSNLVKRVMIAVVLLVSIPWIFKQFYVVQSQIIKSGILPRLVLGETVADSDMSSRKNRGSVSDNELEKVIESSAKDVEFLLFGPFYSLNYKASDLSACTPDSNNPSKHIFGTKDMAGSEKCLKAVAKLMDTDDTIIAQDVNIRDFFRNTNDGGVDQRNFSQFQDLASWTLSNGQFAINYNPIISTLCGGYLVFLLLSFCIDIAGRIFRLLFLQILSPIAVISSIDPTSSGDRLKEWAKECFKVWISLFLRMLIIFLIIQLVRVITNTIYSNSFQIDGYSNSNGIPAWIYIFLILGIFNSAGKIPELIEKATGIKFSGELQLNPFKNPWVAGAAGLGIAGAGMLGANAIGAAKKIGGYFASDEMKEYWNARRSLNAAQSSFENPGYKNELRRTMLNEKIAGAREQKAWSDYLANPNSSIMYNNLEQARAATRAAADERKKAEERYNARGIEYGNAQKRMSAAQAALDKKREDEKWVSQGASAIAGIATGAVSGALRGAQGAYGKGLSGAIQAATQARHAATDAREDRDVRAEMGYKLSDRLRDSIDRFAGVRSDKNYGVGRMDDEIKGLRNELNRVQSQMRASAETLDHAQTASANISNSSLNELAKQLNSATSLDERNGVIKNIEAALKSNSGISATDKDLINSLVNATQHADELLTRSIDVQKQISKRENASNVGPGHGGGPGPGNP